jgi:phosphatidylglycerol:prolipoprotein diacylglycerol transferase
MVAVFCALREKPLLVVLDEMMVPLAVLLALGRLGNFIEGGVIGSATGGAWGVIYPDVEAPRHPVALYESLKNLAIVPVLMLALRRWPSGRGIVTGLFVVLYAGLRVVVDLLRDYESVWLGLGPGQVMNLAMAGAGLILLVWVALRPPFVPPPVPALPRRAGLARMVLLIALVLYPLGIQTSWTAANITEKRAAGALAGG